MVMRDTWGLNHHCPDVHGEEPQLKESTVGCSSPARRPPLLEGTAGKQGAARTTTGQRGVSDLKTSPGYCPWHSSGNPDLSGTTGSIILYNSVTVLSLNARSLIARVAFPTRMHYVPVQQPSVCLSPISLLCAHKTDSFCSNFRPEQLNLPTPPPPQEKSQTRVNTERPAPSSD